LIHFFSNEYTELPLKELLSSDEENKTQNEKDQNEVQISSNDDDVLNEFVKGNIDIDEIIVENEKSLSISGDDILT